MLTRTSPARPRVVLLIDDNRETKAIYARALEAGGFSPLHVRNPLDGLKAAREFQPDAIVTAMLFPGPMDGLALTRQLRLDPRTSRLKVVILTGRDFNTDREAARRAGCDLFLTKPCAPEALVSALHGIGAEAPLAPSTESGLAWSRRGEVACLEHAPARDSERWGIESWRLMPVDVAQGRVHYQCQHCATGPIAHRRLRPVPAQVLRMSPQPASDVRFAQQARGGADLGDRIGSRVPAPGQAHLAPKD